MPGYTNDEHRNQEYSGVDRNTALVLGYSNLEVLDASSGDATPASDNLACRAISADAGGTVKIEFKTAVDGETITEVLTLVSGILRPVRNVSKLFQFYTGSTPGTAASFGSDGVSITNAIKIHI